MPSTAATLPASIPDPAATSLDTQETKEGWLSATERQFRHSGWERDRRRVFAGLQAAGIGQDRLDRFAACGSQAWVLRNAHDHGRFRLIANYCHDRWCVPCCNARARDIREAVVTIAGKRRLRLLTLTLKHTQTPLAQQLTHLWKSFRRLRGYKAWRSRVAGGVAMLEVRWQPVTRRWHPHLHVLLDGTYIPHGDLRALWLKSTGTSHVVDIRAVRGTAHAAGYVAKYATKAWDHDLLSDPDALAEAIRSLGGRRLWLSWGTLKLRIRDLPPDTDTWETVARLATLIDAAAHSQDYAIAILEQLRRTHQWQRPPPFTSPTRGTEHHDVQCAQSY